MKRWFVLLFLWGMLISSVEAATIELGINDFSVQLHVSQPVLADDYGRVEAEGRFLYNNREETRLGSAGLLFAGEPGNVPGLNLGIGGQLYGGRTDQQQDLLALGVGGRVVYAPPVMGGLGVSGRIYYAPQILAGLDADRLLESAIRLGYSITPKVRLYGEYQNVRSDFKNHGNWTIDEGVRLGFEATF